MKKGISLIALIITIAVVITLVSTIAITSTSVYNNTKKIKFASELVYIKELINTYKSNNYGKIPSSKIVYVDLSNVLKEDVNEQFKGELMYDNQVALCQIDFNTLNAKELIYGNLEDSESEDIYCFSNITGKIYYIKGVKIGTNTYYTLTDDLKNSISYVEENNVNDGILFIYNNNVNNKGQIDIKVPSDYTDVSVTSSDNNFEVTKESINEYDVYKTVSSTNSIITVNYKLTDEENLKEIKYFIDNIDTEAPTIEVSEIKTLSANDSQKKFITVNTLNDDFSGIKVLKYANFEIDKSIAKDYFKNKGIKVENNLINVESSLGTISVYAEDNAGNFTIKYVKVDENTEYDYIKDGMVLLLDGTRNTRDGHVTDTNVWEDLSGNNYDLTMENVSVNNNNMYMNGTSSKIYSDDSIDVVSFEIVLELEEKTTSQLIASFGVNSQIIAWNPNKENGLSLGHYKQRYKVDNLYSLNSISVQYNPDYMYLNANNLELILEKESWSKPTTYPLAIGFYNTALCNVKGKVYSVRAYNRALTEEEVKHNYEVDKARFNLQ